MLFKKITATILLLAFLGLTLPQPARAEEWGASLRAAIVEVTFTDMLATIEKTMVANLKIMAIRVIQGRLQVLLTGSCGSYCIGGSSSGFITDWQDYIFGSAQRTAENTVNTFFNGMQSGVGSGMERVVGNAQKALDADVMTQKSDLRNYVSEGKASFIFDPTKTNSSGKAWLMGSAPQNEEALLWLRGYALDKAAFEMQEKKRIAMAQANKGFTPTEKKSTSRGSYTKTLSTGEKYTVEPSAADSKEDGIVSLPGSLKEDITAEIYNMGTNMITFAKSIPEIAANMVAQTLTSAISYGIRQVTDPIDKSITDVRNKVGTSINQAQSQIQQGARESLYFNKKQ